MATVTVHNGIDSSYLYIDYSFSVSGRNWTCTASLKLQMGPTYNFEAWSSACGNPATLRKDGGTMPGGGRPLRNNTYTLAGPTQVGSGTYDVQGNAPSVDVSWAWNVNSTWGNYSCPHGTKTLTGSPIGPAGNAPSGGYVNDLSATWNTITGTYGVTSNGGVALTANEFKILMAPYVSGVPARQYNASTSGIGPRTVTVTNSSPTANNPTWTIKGCGLYYTGIFAQNQIGDYRYQGPTIYTPPAPGQFSYTDPGGIGPKTYTVNFTGVAANNVTDYTPSELTRTVRYKINDGQWVYQQESVQAAITDNTTFSVTIPAGSNAIVEGWMNYRGSSSESVSVVITNSNSPVGLYGSVYGRTVAIRKLYGSYNGETVKIKKLYGSVEGVARKVYEDV